MNARWILAAAAAGALLVVIFAFRAGGPERAQPQTTAPAQRVEPAKPSVPTNQAAASSAPVATPAGGVGAAPAPAVPQILEAIHEASISYDAKELPKIQPYLIHPDPEVRAAALEGVLVLGDAAGSPLLRQAASTLKDPREAVKYLEAADYLELPSGSLLAGKKKAGSPAKDETRKGGQSPARIPFRSKKD